MLPHKEEGWMMGVGGRSRIKLKKKKSLKCINRMMEEEAMNQMVKCLQRKKNKLNGSLF